MRAHPRSRSSLQGDPTEETAAGAPPAKGGYALSVARATATCLVALLVLVGGPWAVSRRAASLSRPDEMLRTAVADEDINAMQKAVAAGARVDGRNRSSMSPLADAVAAGRVGSIKWLVANGADVNGTISTGGTPLFLALWRPEIAAALIHAGADVDARMPSGRTPLITACGIGGVELPLGTVEVLLAGGADVNAACRRGIRPLAVAAETGNVRLVERLIEAGADVNAADAAGATALMAAATDGREEIILVLLRAGADPSATDHRGRTARAIAVRHGHLEAAVLLSPGTRAPLPAARPAHTLDAAAAVLGPRVRTHE